MGSILGGIMGLIEGGKATRQLSTQYQNAEQGVVNAVGQGQAGIGSAVTGGQAGISSAVGAGTSAVNQAGENINTATTGANSTLNALGQQIGQNENPYMEAGAGAASQLSDYSKNLKPFQAPTAQDVQNTPGYQFQLQQGEQATTNAAAAQGLGAGGNTLKALTQYGQGLAGTYYQNAFNNAQQAYQTNQNTTLSNLSELIGSGQNANAEYNSALTGLTGQAASNTIGAANTNASLQQYLASLGLTGATSSAGLGLAGAGESAQLGLSGAKTAGDYAVGMGQTQAAGSLNVGNQITGLGSTLGGMVSGISQLGGMGSSTGP